MSNTVYPAKFGVATDAEIAALAPVQSVNGSTGAVTVTVPPTREASFTTPPTTGWSALNGSATLTSFAANTGGAMVAVAPAGATNDLHLQTRSLPAVGDFTLIACVRSYGPMGGNGWGGIGVSDGTKATMLAVWFTGLVYLTYWSNLTTFSADRAANFYGGSGYPAGRKTWVKLVRSGSNRIWSVSLNGLDWTQVLSQTWTTDLTPDRICFGCNVNSAAGAATVELLSWETT